MAGRHSVQFFVNRAHQHLPPESFDRIRCLALLVKPVQHGNVVQVPAGSMLDHDRQKRPANGKLVPQIQKRQPQKRLREMQRRRQQSAPEDRNPPARLHKRNLGKKMDLVLYSQPAIEVEQVHAAPQQNVLAVIDHFRIRQ